MQCPRCHAQNREGARFCEDCGNALAASCPSCGAEVAPEKRFCGSCGARVDVAVAGSRFASPRNYTPAHLAEKIHTSRRALEGERKQVTVLFADTKGSTELIADRDPEEAREILDFVVERMMEAVHRYEGTVNQVMGDGIMALFGAPLAHEDHAARACYAALAMQEAIAQHAGDLRARHGADVQIRIGLNSGEVMVRSIRKDLRMDYAATGRTVHLAARMEQLARPGATLITAATFTLIEGLFEVNPLGSLPIKGISDPVEIYELGAARSSRTRFQAATAVRGLTRLVGRTSELQRLREILARTADGHGQLAALVGEPGVGKSRLVYEFARSQGTLGWMTLDGQAASYARQTAYFSLVALLRAYFVIDINDNMQQMRTKVTERLLALDSDLEDTVPALLWLLDIQTEDLQWQELDAAVRRERTAASLQRLLVRESRARPLLLVFEDLHWIDAETQFFLDALVEILPTARIMLIVTYRPDFEHRWSGLTYYTQLRIDSLPSQSAEELLAALVGRDASLQGLKQVLIGRTEGNPFFLEETVRALIESQTLVGERGAFRTSAAIDEISIPPSVQAVLAARIDRLTPEQKHLLQAAAVIGDDVALPLLREIAQLPNTLLLSTLQKLQAAEFLYETALYPEIQYTFKHSLTQEVAYSGLLREHRKSLHAAVVEAVERLYPDRLAERVEALARHAMRGEVWDKAVLYLRQAGLQAAKRSAHQEALLCFNDALGALRHLPQDKPNLEQAVELHFAARNALWPLWDHAKISEHLAEAERLATALGDRRQLGWVASFMVQHHRIMGDPESAIQAAERALVIARDVEDIDLQIDTSFRVALTCLSVGQYARAADFLIGNVTALDGERTYERLGQPGFPSVLSRAWLAICLAEQGQFGEAIKRGTEAIAIAEKVDHVYSLVSALFGLGGTQLYQGDLSAAQRTLETGLSLCRRYNIPVLLRLVLSELGYAHVLAGRIDEAIPLLEEAAEVNRSKATMARHALYLAWLSEAFLLHGQFDEANRLCREAINVAQRRKERGHEAWALRLSAEIHSRGPSQEFEAAEAFFLSATALADKLGMRPLAALARLGRGKLWLKRGMASMAQGELLLARRLFDEMEMRLWQHKAEQALASIGKNS